MTTQERDNIVYLKQGLKWPKRCKICKDTIPEGMPAWWFVLDKSYAHKNCYAKPNASPAPSTKSSNSKDNPIQAGAKDKAQPQPLAKTSEEVSSRTEPKPLSDFDINKIYDQAIKDLEANGFEAQGDIVAIAVKLRLEKHIEGFWLAFSKYEQNLKDLNAKRWGK